MPVNNGLPNRTHYNGTYEYERISQTQTMLRQINRIFFLLTERIYSVILLQWSTKSGKTLAVISQHLAGGNWKRGPGEKPVRKCFFLIWGLVPRVWKFIQLHTDHLWISLSIYIYFPNKEIKLGTFPGGAGPVVKTSPSYAGGAGWIPGWEVKIPQTLQPKNQNIKQKWYCNEFNKDFKKVDHIKKRKRNKISEIAVILKLG